MKRRNFLGAMFAALAIDPRELWTPEKTYFIPDKPQLYSVSAVMNVRMPRWIIVNVERTMQSGLWHDGLGGPNDKLTLMSFASASPIIQAAFLKLPPDTRRYLVLAGVEPSVSRERPRRISVWKSAREEAKSCRK